MTDAGQHGGALFDLTLDALAHLDKGEAGAAYFLRAARAEIARHRSALAEALGGFGKGQDRPYLVAQERDGDHQQHQRGADHPNQEDMRVRGIGLAAAHEDAQHLAFELDADLDDVGIANRVDPEGAVDLPGDLRRQSLVSV